MTERLHFHFSFSCIGEGNGNPLQCSCLENPRDGGAWWAAVFGVAQSRTRLKWLSSSSRVSLNQSPGIPREQESRNGSQTSLTFLLSLFPSLHCFLLFLIFHILITLLAFFCEKANYKMFWRVLEFDNTDRLRVIWNIWWLLSVPLKSKSWKPQLIFLNKFLLADKVS